MHRILSEVLGRLTDHQAFKDLNIFMVRIDNDHGHSQLVNVIHSIEVLRFFRRDRYSRIAGFQISIEEYE